MTYLLQGGFEEETLEVDKNQDLGSISKSCFISACHKRERENTGRTN